MVHYVLLQWHAAQVELNLEAGTTIGMLGNGCGVMNITQGQFNLRNKSIWCH